MIYEDLGIYINLAKTFFFLAFSQWCVLAQFAKPVLTKAKLYCSSQNTCTSILACYLRRLFSKKLSGKYSLGFNERFLSLHLQI